VRSRPGYPSGMSRLTVVAVLAAAALLPATADAHGDGARVFVTTPDRALELSDQGTVPFRSAPPTIAVDPRQGFQVMEGFGASITDSSAAVLYRLDRRTRDRAMAALFRRRAELPAPADGRVGLRRRAPLHL
jgi:glucosylceramidase